MMQYLDLFSFAVLPYVAIFVFLIVTIQRYRRKAYTYSSLSSQFLENQYHFWGLVPFHYGILTVLAGHVVAFLVPRSILMWNQVPLRLYILEVSALAFGMLASVGIVNIIVRHAANARSRIVTSPVDWVVYGCLLFQFSTGIGIAIFHGWGSSWFASTLSPYLWSLVKFRPALEYVIGLPFLAKLHIITAYLLILFFPFTRLVHVLVIPNPYLWRRHQVVRWYWNRKQIRQIL